MNILVACEESQRVCIEFRKKGHNAFSCDLLPCSGGFPEYHIIADVTLFLDKSNIVFSTEDGRQHFINHWDMLLAFPPCTFLSKAGAMHMFKGGKLNEERYRKMLNARDFFMKFYNSSIKYKCIENPTPLKICNLPEPTQIIQPFMFGEPFKKRTLLWLFNLPKLQPTEIVENPVPFVNGGSFNKNGKRRKTPGLINNQKERIKTFIGIAKAMAEQWG